MHLQNQNDFGHMHEQNTAERTMIDPDKDRAALMRLFIEKNLHANPGFVAELETELGKLQYSPDGGTARKGQHSEFSMTNKRCSTFLKFEF